MFPKTLKSNLLPAAIIFVIPLLIVSGAFLPNRAFLPADLLYVYPAQ